MPRVARKMPTCLSHQSTQTINHPLPTHTVAVLWGLLPTEPLPRAGRKLLGPSWAVRLSREVAGRSDSRWASSRGCPCSRPFPLPWPPKGRGRLSQPGSQPLSQWRRLRRLASPSDAGEVTGPFNLQNPCAERVREAWPHHAESAQGVFPSRPGSPHGPKLGSGHQVPFSSPRPPLLPHPNTSTPSCCSSCP